MKTFSKFLIALMAVSLLAGCGSSDAPSTTQPNQDPASATTAAPTETTAAPVLDLAGEWKQANSNSETNYQAATIKDGAIEISWINEDDDSRSLYWAGTYVAPEDAAEPYSWDSENDTAKTDVAMLASTAPTKTFTYEDGVLSYEASALGTTKTIKLERVK